MIQKSKWIIINPDGDFTDRVPKFLIDYCLSSKTPVAGEKIAVIEIDLENDSITLKQKEVSHDLGT